MIKIPTIVILLLWTILCNGQHFVDLELIPNNNSNFRFIGDTTMKCSDISITKLYDTNKKQYYYKATQECGKKMWTKQRGYTKVWWIDNNDNLWKSSWQMGFYWSYALSKHHKEVVFYKYTNKKQILKYLNAL